MEFTFKVTEEVSTEWKTGKFIIDDLKIVGSNVEFAEVKLYLDNALYEDTMSTWAGTRLHADDIFEQVLSAYLRNDTLYYESFGEDWSYFNTIKLLTEEKDGLVMKLPVISYNGTKVYELDLATLTANYYHYQDEFLILDATDHSILTDAENFFGEALDSDLAAIFKGDCKCLYMSEDIKKMVKEFGGEAAWIKEYSEM